MNDESIIPYKEENISSQLSLLISVTIRNYTSPVDSQNNLNKISTNINSVSF